MWDPNLTDAQRERLDLLIEECTEVIKAACKIKRFGYWSTYGGNHPPNIEELIAELGDVMAIMTLMKVEGEINVDGVEDARNDKLERMRPYVRFQQNAFDLVDAWRKSGVEV